MDRKTLIALGLSLTTVWIFNQYITKKYIQPEQGGVVSVGQAATVTPGQPVKVISSQELCSPLALDIDFVEQKLPSKEETVVVQTDYCTATLSTYGAVLTNLDFKEHVGKSKTPLRTISNRGLFEAEARKKGCYLLALDGKTPYAFEFVTKNESDTQTEVMFKCVHENWVIHKTYVFYKDSYKVDVILDCESMGTHACEIKPRLFLTAPFVGECEDDTISLISWNESKQSLETTEPDATKGLAWFWYDSKPIFGAQDRYFVHSLINDPEKFVQRAYVKQFDSRNVSLILEGPTLSVPQKYEWAMTFYMGPKLADHLNSIDERLDEVLSFGWLSTVCKLLLKLLSWVYDFVGNFGLAIIIMTFLLKLPFVPLSIYSRKQMEVYQRYLPSINRIRTKYRQDVRLQHEELMKFYKEHNISPTTQFVGCLPLLIQMPILFSLYRVLANYLDLYQAPFCGWITDLSAKDPFYVLPLLMGASMIWQQRTTPITDEKQKTMMLVMPIIMTAVFINFPAGLVLYWLTNNILTILEDYFRKCFFK